MSWRTGAAATAALALCAACGSSTPTNAVTKCQQTSVVPSRTDVLFVVDDSGSMQAEQQKLAASFGAFITRLAGSAVKNDFQIGVTNTSIDFPVADTSAAGFALRTAYASGPATGTPYPAGALVAIDPTTPGKILYDAAAKAFTGTRILSGDSPTLTTDFVANVAVGTSGSGKEQGLRAARLALTDRIADGTNAGFLRQGARLAVVIVSDEDDCSDPASPPAIVYPSTGDACHSAADQAKLPPVSDFAAVLRAELAGEKRDVVVAIIAGVDRATGQPVQPTCNATGGYPAFRYTAFAGAFGAEALADSVCAVPDFSATLESVANLIAQQITLSEAPADPRLLTVAVAHPDGTRTPCAVAPTGGDTSAAGAIYAAPQGSSPPTLTFQGQCALSQGDRVELDVLCAN